MIFGLTIPLLLLLVSCGRGGGAGNTAVADGALPPSDLVWQSTYLEMPEVLPDFSNPVFVDGAIFYFANVYTDILLNGKSFSSETENSAAERGSLNNAYPPLRELRFFSMKPDGSAPRLIEGFEPSSSGSASPSEGSYRIGATALADGQSMFIVENGDFNYLDEETGQWIRETPCVIRKIELSTGATVSDVDIAELSGKYPNIEIEHIAVSGDGMLATAAQYRDSRDERDLLVTALFDENGGYAGSAETDVSDKYFRINDLITLADGTLAVLIFESGKNAVCPIDMESGALNESIGEIPYNFNNIVGISESGEIISESKNGLELAKPGQTVSHDLLSWLDCDVDIYNSQFIAIPDSETVICSTLIVDEISAKQSLITIKRIPKSESKQKTILTLACVDLDYATHSEILSFNKTNSGLRIKVIDYNRYNTNDDTSAGVTRLNTEIISGNIPDIILLENLPHDVYSSRGVLADLYPYLESDAEIGGRDGIVPVVRKVSENDGKLYRMASSFSISTLLGNADYAGNENNWTVSDMKLILQTNDGMRAFGQFVSRDDVLQEILDVNLEEYVNYEDGTVLFGTPEFIQLLDFIKTLPTDRDTLYSAYLPEDEMLSVYNGAQLAAVEAVINFRTFMENATLLEDKDAYKGYPCSNGKGSSLRLHNSVAMSSKCSDKEGAWSFMRRMFVPIYQYRHAGAFPTNSEVFDAQIADLMTPMYLEPIYDDNGELLPMEMSGEFEYCRVDENGNIEGPKGFATARTGNGEDTYLPYYAMTEEQRGRFMAFIDGIDRVWNEDLTLLNIVAEELAPFFAGQKDAASAAKIIQSRAEIYVNERR
jgi:ABC-type glycerol-3-phosphate transport system substrate-binding protein